MDFAARLKARERAELCKGRYYPDTCAEYVKILDNYLKLCQESNVRPIILLFPVSECYKKYFPKKMRSEFLHFVGEALKKFPDAVFVDGWKMSGFDDSNFFDADHMNIKGAAKFSGILNDVIIKLEEL